MNGGWFGPVNNVVHALGTVNADRDEDGKFCIYGEAVASGIGGVEAVVPAGAMYSVGGQKRSLAGLLNSTSYGLRNVTVIS